MILRKPILFRDKFIVNKLSRSLFNRSLVITRNCSENYPNIYLVYHRIVFFGGMILDSKLILLEKVEVHRTVVVLTI